MTFDQIEVIAMISSMINLLSLNFSYGKSIARKLVWFDLVLWHINHYRLFEVKNIFMHKTVLFQTIHISIYIYIYIYIYMCVCVCVFVY